MEPLSIPPSVLFEKSPTIVEASCCPSHGGNWNPPGMLEDRDLHPPPSSISTASVPSASSSAIGSPQSHHGHVGNIAYWNQQRTTPSIIPNESNPCNTEYISSGPGMEECALELTSSKLPRFVGEFPKLAPFNVTSWTWFVSGRVGC